MNLTHLIRNFFFAHILVAGSVSLAVSVEQKRVLSEPPDLCWLYLITKPKLLQAPLSNFGLSASTAERFEEHKVHTLDDFLELDNSLIVAIFDEVNISDDRKVKDITTLMKAAAVAYKNGSMKLQGRLLKQLNLGRLRTGSFDEDETELGLPDRVKKILFKNNINDIDELASVTRAELESIEGLGAVSIIMIESKLARRGLHLENQEPTNLASPDTLLETINIDGKFLRAIRRQLNIWTIGELAHLNFDRLIRVQGVTDQQILKAQLVLLKNGHHLEPE